MLTSSLLKLIVLLLVTGALLYISRASLRSRGSHGFYRFFAWEAILILTLLNLEHWFEEPFSVPQLVSWVCLAVSIFLVIHGIWLLRLVGRPDGLRKDAALIGWEKTTTLVTLGVYRYIRHPLYSSLLFLAWGVFFKSPSWPGGCLAVTATVFLTLTARVEETENIGYFGTNYAEYMRRTKRFVPFLF